MLVGGVALAQQGFIVEPWRKAPRPAAAPVPPLRAMPGSGLAPAPANAAAQATHKALVAPQPVVEPFKWSPPVVELLVDPWARGQPAAPAARPHWVPTSVEIVDPWADEVAQTEPRVASHQAGTPHSTIF
jgi:hypothetical protein